MILLSGADLVLPDRILASGTLVIDGDRITDVRAGGTSALHGHYIVPGFIDVHVHGIEGVDALDADDNAIVAIAQTLPRYGVTAFCPTTVACTPRALARVLGQVRRAREAPAPQSARVLPAHLESNFISQEYRGAQPAACLRSARRGAGPVRSSVADPDASDPQDRTDFIAADILREFERSAPDIAIVTVAPEIDGGVELIGELRARGHHVSLGHSGASFEQAQEAIAAGATQATHLFNRMPPLAHRAPGLAGAVLQTDEVAAEIICDGFHVHPALVRMAIAAKRPARIMAITDGTAGSGLPVGARTSLGGRPISVGQSAAYLDDGTVAGSVLTMESAFRLLVSTMGVPVVDAVSLCATTPARELGLTGHGLIVPGAMADLVVLDANLAVVQTYVGGQLVYSRNTAVNRSV